LGAGGPGIEPRRARFADEDITLPRGGGM
jgi:hypothetical protein